MEKEKAKQYKGKNVDKIIEKNKKLFVTRFLCFAEKAPLLYTLLEKYHLTNEIYEISEIILFDNNAGNFDCAISGLNELVKKFEFSMENIENDKTKNYTSLLFCKLGAAILRHEKSETMTTARKMNLLYHYNNCFIEEARYDIATFLEETDPIHYDAVPINNFIGIISENYVREEELLLENGFIDIKKTKSL